MSFGNVRAMLVIVSADTGEQIAVLENPRIIEPGDSVHFDWKNVVTLDEQEAPT